MHTIKPNNDGETYDVVLVVPSSNPLSPVSWYTLAKQMEIEVAISWASYLNGGSPVQGKPPSTIVFEPAKAS
jgi:hypothetical protein